MDDRYYPKFIGSPGCQHGSYTFYKAFKYYKQDKCRILMLGEFFFVKISSDDDPCIGELQLLWEDRNTDQMLSSVRLYFLPEQTPLGRQSHHGEHEVIAANEKVILRLEDLVSWITDEVDWNHGLRGVYQGSVDSSSPACLSPFYPGTNGSVIKDGTDLAKVFMDNNTGLDFDDVHKERELIGDNQDPDALGICIITYPRYLRYSAMLRRLNGEVGKWLSNTLIIALGGFTVTSRNVYILFCRDFFDHEGLAQNDANCDHLAPIFKGRPRKKKPKSLINSDYQYTENHVNKIKTSTSKKSLGHVEEGFLRNLFEFMKTRNTPIHRVPNLGFKQIDLYLFFSLVQKLGGYEQITHKKQWKLVYDELGGNPGSTSAATCTRRHYERLLLPYERHLNGEDDKPLPPPPPPRIRNKKLSPEKEKNDMNQDDLVCLYTDNEISQNRNISNDKLYDISNGKEGELDSHDEYMDDSEEKQEWLENIKEENICELDSNNYLENHNPTFMISRNNGCEEKERKWKEIREKNAIERNWARQLRPPKTAKKGTLERYQQMLKDAMQQHQEPHPKIKSEINKIEQTSKTIDNDHVLRTIQPVLSLLPNNCRTNLNHSSKLVSSTSHNYYLSTTEHNSSSDILNESRNGNVTTINNYSTCSNSSTKVYMTSPIFSSLNKSETSCSIPLTKDVCYMGQYPSSKYDNIPNSDKKNRNNFSIMSPLMHRKSSALPSGQSTFGYANEKYSALSEDISIHIPQGKNFPTDAKSLGYDKNNEYCQLRPSVICHTEPARSVDRKIMPALIKDKHNSSTSAIFSSLSSVTHYKGNSSNSEESNKLILPINKKLPENTAIKPISSTVVNKVKMYDKVPDKCKLTEITKLNPPLEVSILKNCHDDDNKHSKIYKLSRIKMEEGNLQNDKELKTILSSQKPKISCISQHPIIDHDIKTAFNNHTQAIKLDAYTNSVISRNSKYKYDEPYFNQPKRLQLTGLPNSCIKSNIDQAHNNYKTIPFTPIDDVNPPVVLDLSVKKKPQSTGLETVVPSPSPPKTPADGICLDLSLKRKVINTSTASPPSGIENITPPPEEIEPPLYHSSPFVVSVMKSSPHLTIPVINNVGNSKLFSGLSQERKLHSDALSNRAPVLNSESVSSTAIDIPSTPSPSPLPNNIKSTSKSVTSYNYNYSPQSLEYTSLRSSFWSPQVTAYYIPPDSKQTDLDSYKEIVDQGNLQYQYHMGPHLYPVLFKEGQTYPK